MSDDKAITDWIRVQYHSVGFDGKGTFIGKKKFKRKVTDLSRIQLPSVRQIKIRQLVNKMSLPPPEHASNSVKPAESGNDAVQAASSVSPAGKSANNSAVATSSANSAGKPGGGPTKTTSPATTAKTSQNNTNRATLSVTTTTTITKPERNTMKAPPPVTSVLTPRSNLSTTSPVARASRLTASSNQKLSDSSIEIDGSSDAMLHSKNEESSKNLNYANLRVYLPSQQNYGAAQWEGKGVDRQAISVSDTFTNVAGPARVPVPENAKISQLQAFLDGQLGGGDRWQHVKTGVLPSSIPSLSDQLCLLNIDDDVTGRSDTDKVGLQNIRNAVIVSIGVLQHYDSSLVPQYGLLGQARRTKVTPYIDDEDRRVFLNTNIPFSAFICGLQGSGKSHTMSCIIENCLIRSPTLGALHRPLSALVIHFGQYTSYQGFQVCEAAFLACSHPQFQHHPSVSSMTVLVSPSNYHNLKISYMQIPGVIVRPFKLQSRDLNISSLMTLMSVNQSGDPPLYMAQVTRILREMASGSPGPFDYIDFKRRLNEASLERLQRTFLTQRLDLLESFLDLEDSRDSAASYTFKAGGVAIIDLSCPFVDSNTACVLFNIALGMFLEANTGNGKLICVDEAHKYMVDTPAAEVLTESLLTIIRQQRHYGARVVISTQEPTISPRLMDLCSATFLHRFSSPEWFGMVRRHVAMVEEGKESAGGLQETFQRILGLRVGEALVYAPSAMLSDENGGERCTARQLGPRLFQVQVRKRITWDGGSSIVCL